MSGYRSAEFSTNAPVLVEVRCRHGRPVAWVYEDPTGDLHIHTGFNAEPRRAGTPEHRRQLDRRTRIPGLDRLLDRHGYKAGVQREWVDGALADPALGQLSAGCADCRAQPIDRALLGSLARSAAAGRHRRPLPRKARLEDVVQRPSTP